jgi:chromosomal replication initiation ATPase DnaA
MIQKSIESLGRAEHATEERRTKGFADLAALPSNLGAIEAGTRFAEGITPFVAIIGAPGWGKTHLLTAVAQYMRLRGAPTNRPIAATVYATFPDRSDEQLPLILDDVQDAWTNMRTKQELRRLLERRFRAKRHTMVAFADSVSRQEATRFLPNSRDWGYQAILSPSKAERDHVVRQIADSEGVKLSKPIVTLISRHLFGNGRSIQGAVHNLKLVRQGWSRREDVCEACGVLMPYIHGENGWDPRDVVLDVVNNTFAAHRVDGVSSEQVCAYMLISKMGLSEYDVATFLGVSPTKAYAMSNGVKLQINDPALSRCVLACHDGVVRSLDTDSC